MFLTVDNSLDTRKAATGAALVTPDDAGDLTRGPGGVATCTLWVIGAGALHVLTQEGDDIIISAVPANTFLPLQVTRVFATGTTATNIVALY
jgi:hypothetical protein